MPAVAGHWYQTALRLLPEAAEAEERIELLSAGADVLVTGGRLADARAALLEAIDLLPASGTAQLRVRLVAACAGVEQRLGLQREAHARLVAGLDRLTDPGSDEGVALMVALSADAFYRIEFQAMKEWGARAVEGVRGSDNRPLVAAAHAAEAMGCALTGAVAEAEEHRVVAAGLLDAMPDDEVVLRLDAVGHLVGAELYLEHFEATATHARRGIEITRAAGQGEVFPTLFPALGTATWVLGRLAESAAVLDEAVESARLSGNVQTLAWALFNRSIAALMAGDVETALATGEESVEVGRALDDGFLSAHAGIIFAAAILEDGDAARSVEMLVRAGGGEEILVVPGGWRAMFLETLARGWLALGRVDDARVAASRAHEVAELVGLPRPASLAHRASAAVALFAGDAAGAVTAAGVSVELAEQAEARVDAAMSRVLLGRALAATGDSEGAIIELDRASAAFDVFGATRYRDRTDQELRRLGRRISHRSPQGISQVDGIASLSGRELEVARLVVDRHTNPEIAAELFLSLKTVETHMRHIFVKLGVSSRADVARMVERAAPTPA
jgi:DNA-binding NarL/FixJ family response regulator